MPEQFHQYYLTKTLSKKYSHATYLASPVNPQRGHGEPERQVILTVFTSSLFRFLHERESLVQRAQRIKQLQHPYLVPILDMGIEEEQPFVVREYLPSGSLRSRLKQIAPDRLGLGDALTIVLKVGEALAYVHKHHIVHSNIKAENVLFDSSGQAVLTDFNLVDRKDAIIRDQTAQEYAFCYLAPEQFAGTYDARSDQYALGCLTYELITGRVPFAAQSLASMMGQPNNTLPAPLSESVADLPPSLEAAVLKTLAKDPAERFFDFSLFLDVIRSVLSPPPAFPLARSTSFRKNRTIAHTMQPAEAKAKAISSPISNRAATSNPVPPSPELSEATSRVEVDTVEPMNTSSLSQVSMPEWAGILPFPYDSLILALQSYQFTSLVSGETYPIGDRENESRNQASKVQESNGSSTAMPQLEFPTAKQDMTTQTVEKQAYDLSLTNLPVQEEKVVLPAIASTSSAHDHSEYAANETTLVLTRHPDVGGIRPAQLLHDRRRVLGLAVLLSVIVALITYGVLPLVMTTRNTSSQKRVVTSRARSVPTVQVSAQVTTIPTIQPSATATPTVQASVPIVTVPTMPSPSPIPTLIPLPTNYEAEVQQNTIAKGAEVVSCSGCSEGYRVGYLGKRVKNGININGILQFNNVDKDSAGSYSLTVYYSNGSSSSRTGYISVNGGSAVTFEGPPIRNWDTVGILNVVVSLNAGNNTIKFYNPYDEAPSIDKIVV